MIGLKRIPVGQIERRAGRAVPRAATYGPAVVQIGTVALIVRKRLLAAIRPEGRARPLGHVARGMIHSVTIRFVRSLCLVPPYHRDRNAGVLLPVVERRFGIADGVPQAIVEFVGTAGGLFPFRIARQRDPPVAASQPRREPAGIGHRLEPRNTGHWLIVPTETAILVVFRPQQSTGPGLGRRFPRSAGLRPIRVQAIAGCVRYEIAELGIRHLEHADKISGQPDIMRLAGVGAISNQEMTAGYVGESRGALARKRWLPRGPRTHRQYKSSVAVGSEPVPEDRKWIVTGAAGVTSRSSDTLNLSQTLRNPRIAGVTCRRRGSKMRRDA